MNLEGREVERTKLGSRIENLNPNRDLDLLRLIRARRAPSLWDPLYEFLSKEIRRTLRQRTGSHNEEKLSENSKIRTIKLNEIIHFYFAFLNKERSFNLKINIGQIIKCWSGLHSVLFMYHAS